MIVWYTFFVFSILFVDAWYSSENKFYAKYYNTNQQTSYEWQANVILEQSLII